MDLNNSKRRVGRPKNTLIDCTIQVRMKEDTYKILKDYCIKEETTVSEFVRRTLRKEMKGLGLID